VPIVRKKRRDALALFSEGQALTEMALRDEGSAASRAERLAAGLHALWPAPLTAVLLANADGGGLAVVDEAGRPRPDWHGELRPQLTPWAEGGGAGAAPAAESLGLPDHFLHGVAVAWGERRFGTVALALHKRSDDAALAQALLTNLADHVGFRLFLDETGRLQQSRYRDLADLTNLVGHEFNNVLNSVGLQVAALGTKGLTAEHFPELGEVRKQVAAAGRMVRRLQDFCHKGSPPRQPSDLNRAVRAALDADPALARRVHSALGADLPPVQGTALDLERLAAGLLRGSASAEGPGAEPLTVATGKGAGAGVWLQVEGAGHDPDDEQLSHLFDPFVPLRPGDDGVGLALAKAIARRLGGNLRGEKRAGGGVLFVAELRVAE
jgi:signal transduction histidine kinase